MLQRFNSVLLHNTLSVDHPTFWFFCVFNPGDLYYQKKNNNTTILWCGLDGHIHFESSPGSVDECRLNVRWLLTVRPRNAVSSPLLLLTTHYAYRVWFYLLSTMYTRVICNSTHTVTECYCLTGLSFWICSSLGHVKETFLTVLHLARVADWIFTGVLLRIIVCWL